jgi:hypothetical protein
MSSIPSQSSVTSGRPDSRTSPSRDDQEDWSAAESRSVSSQNTNGRSSLEDLLENAPHTSAEAQIKLPASERASLESFYEAKEKTMRRASEGDYPRSSLDVIHWHEPRMSQRNQDPSTILLPTSRPASELERDPSTISLSEWGSASNLGTELQTPVSGSDRSSSIYQLPQRNRSTIWQNIVTHSVDLLTISSENICLVLPVMIV